METSSKNPPGLAGSERQKLQPSPPCLNSKQKVSLMRHEPTWAWEAVPQLHPPFIWFWGKSVLGTNPPAAPLPRAGKPWWGWGHSSHAQPGEQGKEAWKKQGSFFQRFPQKNALFHPNT